MADEYLSLWLFTAHSMSNDIHILFIFHISSVNNKHNIIFVADI